MKIIDRISNSLFKVLSPFAEFMSVNKYATVIRESLTVPISLIIIGSFALLLNTYICTTTGLAGFASLAWLADYSGIFTTINFACISCLALVCVILIGYKLGLMNNVDPYTTMLVALVGFMILSNQEELSANLGAKSLFLAFIAGILSVEFFTKLMSIERLKIKMPDAVPEIIAKVFNALFPMAFTFILLGVFATILKNATGLYLNDLIYKFIQTPFVNIMDTQLGISIIVVLIQVLWWFGLHGNTAVKAITAPIFAINLTANMDQLQAGLTPTHIYTQPLQQAATQMGGAGLVLSMALAILLFSKRTDYREITKASFIPLIFNISEPLVFGLPIMLNPALIIPFILAPLIGINIWYIACNIGFIAPAAVYVSNRVPSILKQFLEFGSWNAVILTIATIIIGILIYAPFIKVLDKMGNKEDEELVSE